MSAFLYFVAGLSKPVELADLPGLGLTYAFEDAPQCSPISGRTPTSAPGMLIWSQSRIGPMTPAFNPDKQIWRKAPGSENLHVGVYRDALPTPATLRRKAALMDGPLLQLGDGNEWMAPRLSLWGADGGFTPAYSMVADLDDDGNWISGGASPESQHMKELFDRLYPWMEDPSGVEAGQALDAACELLGINYVVSKVELAMLKVLKTDDTLIRILSTALDWETVIEWSKKKMQEASPEVSAG